MALGRKYQKIHHKHQISTGTLTVFILEESAGKLMYGLITLQSFLYGDELYAREGDS